MLAEPARSTLALGTAASCVLWASPRRRLGTCSPRWDSGHSVSTEKLVDIWSRTLHFVVRGPS